MMKEYKVKFVNYILDSVHGPIGLTGVEDVIERLPIFKRLQDISQLGLVKRIFPCALHSRYVHSLGVMFVADKMALQLHLNDNERQLLRLAALLHDIGHYPLSHDMEATYSEYYSAAHRECCIESPTSYNIIKNLQKNEEEVSIELDGHETKKYHHETIGALIIRNNISIKECIANAFVCDNEYFKDEMTGNIDVEDVTSKILDDIASIITGNARHDSVYFRDAYPVMVQLIHSEMDADNIDYLLRDAAFSGTTYGVMDMSLLIDSLAVKRVKFKMPDNFGHPTNYYDREYSIVGVKPKGIGYVDQFMINRYFAYNQVIYHKYTSIISLMLKKAVLWMLDTGRLKDYRDPRKMAEDVDTNKLFMSFNDNLIISEIERVDTTKNDCPEVIRKFIEYLRNYRALSLSSYPSQSDNDMTYTAIDNYHAYEMIVSTSKLYEEIKEIAEAIDAINEKNKRKKTRKWHISPEAQEVIQKALLINIDTRRITKQMPKEKYELLLKAHNRITPEKRDRYDFDRLMNGIPIIDEQCERPELIIDSSASVLNQISGQQCIRMRKYVF